MEAPVGAAPFSAELHEMFKQKEQRARPKAGILTNELLVQLQSGASAQSHRQTQKHITFALPEVSADYTKKFTSRVVTVKKRFVPKCHTVLDRCFINKVNCVEVLSAVQGLARIVVALCQHRRPSATNMSPLASPPYNRPHSWSVQGLENGEISRPRGASAGNRMCTPEPQPRKASITSQLHAVQVSLLQEQQATSPATLDSLKKASLTYLDPLIANLTAAGSAKLNREQFSRVLETIRKMCSAVELDMATEMDQLASEGSYEVTREVFDKKRNELIEIVEKGFTEGEQEVTMRVPNRGVQTRRSKSCSVHKPDNTKGMRRTLSDAKRLSAIEQMNPGSSCETVRHSTLSSDSDSSTPSSIEDEMGKGLQRRQRKKIRAAIAQTIGPTNANMRRRTSSTLTQDELLNLGVRRLQLRENSIISETTETECSESDIDSLSNRSGWRDSGIETSSSIHYNNQPSDDDELYSLVSLGPRPLSSPDFGYSQPRYVPHSGPLVNNEEFLSIEVSGELGGHFSKNKKTLGTSPNNMGRYFRIHVKTNIDKLQLQSYVIYRKFKDVLTLYDSLAGQCPEGVTLPEKPDRRLFNKKQNKVQVERLLLSVASNPRLRTMEPVIDFLKPDCLPLEETPHTTLKTPQCNTPPSSDSVNNVGGDREHPNSAEAGESDKLAEFFTPDTSTGEAGTDHAPQPVHVANGTGNESPSLVRKTFRQLMMQKSEVEGTKEEDENPPIVIKEQERTVLLMMWSHEKEGYTVEGGEMEQLVEQLYSGDRPDADYVQTFLLGFKHFMKPEELMEMLIKKFESIQDEGDNMAVVKLRLSEVVAQWLERVWVDFHYSEVMCDKVDRYIQLVSSGHPQFLPVAMKLRTTKQKKQKEWELSLKDEHVSPGSEPSSQCASPAESPDMSLRRYNSDTRPGTLSKKAVLCKLTMNDLSHAQLARHLHVVDFDFMCKVELHEYLTHLWCRKDPQYQTLKKHLDDWINFWNRISLWVASEIIKEDTPKARATKIGTFVEVAKQLKQLFSYNMLHAFIVGFNHSSVRRLRKTWDLVASKHQNALSELEDLMSQDSNFSSYRKHRDKVPKTVCTIPLLSLFLKDLEFLNAGNPAKLKNGLWNFGKLRLLKKQISGLERYKLNKPNSIQTDDEIIKFCHQLSYLEGDLLYPMSLEKEPRDAPRVTRPLSVSSMSSVATSSSS